MGLLTFKRGIHPDDCKKLTSEIPIKELQPGKIMCYPLNQHLGAPLNPLVSVGDEVLMGQKIADSDSFLTAPLHSSVSGKVVEIGMRMHHSGAKVPTIVIENDGLDTPAEKINTKSLDELSPKEIIKIVHDAGIVGMGGAGFPTHVKLSPPVDKEIKYVIVNGAECEPYLTSDHRVMLEEPDDVLFGLTAVMKIFSLKEGFVAVEENKPDAISVLEEKAKNYSGTRVLTLKKKYPQGAEKQLIYAVTKKEVPSGGLPADIGCMVLNIDTITAIARAIKNGTPLYRRIVTVSGGAIKNPQNFKVRIGMCFDDLIEEAGGFLSEPAKIIYGGPMMGVSGVSTAVPVVKGTSAFLAFTEKEVQKTAESACLRCGRCVSVCPMGLMPAELSVMSIKGEIESVMRYNALDCIECGSCSFVCPAKRHLVQAIRVGKDRARAHLAEMRAKKQ